MIKIGKTGEVPSKLTGDGTTKKAEHCAEYDNDPDAYRAGDNVMDIDGKIYGAASVKRALKKTQNNKCCYCESKFTSTSPGDVEHFRPKAWVQQELGSPKDYPGYYWIAYDWENLFLSCEICNRSHKRNFFPLFNPEARARSHHEDIGQERPLLANPGGPENPRNHIIFRQDFPVGITIIGKKTIDVLGLRRSDLTEQRIGHLKHLTLINDSIRLLEDSTEPEKQEHVSRSRAFLDDAVKPDAIFSSMTRDWVCANNVIILYNADID